MRLDEDDLIRADVIRRLMCHGALDYRDTERRYMIGFARYFATARQRLQALRDDGLVELSADGLRATSRGWLLLRIIAMCFDNYLSTASTTAATPRFSRTV